MDHSEPRCFPEFSLHRALTFFTAPLSLARLSFRASLFAPLFSRLSSRASFRAPARSARLATHD
eukprot:6174073-Pleurochrysis_carterae.AAC.3